MEYTEEYKVIWTMIFITIAKFIISIVLVKTNFVISWGFSMSKIYAT